jgi:UvrD-like helicase C-terminal domain
MKLYSRNGHEWTKRLAGLAEALQAIPRRAVVLDAELCFPGADGGPDFGGLRTAFNPPEDAVVLSTIHSAKGLEWDTVFMVSVEDGVLPHINADDVEEERRVAYVGMTRARRQLGLTYAGERYGDRSRPSPFLFEILAEKSAVAFGRGQDWKERMTACRCPPRMRNAASHHLMTPPLCRCRPSAGGKDSKRRKPGRGKLEGGAD